MRDAREDGYILASALGMLLAISLVAIALVTTSADALKRVKASERDAASNAALRSAILVAGSQLAIDPRRRQLDFTDGVAAVDVAGRQVNIDVRFENAKLDVNLAELAEIEAALLEAEVPAPTRNAIAASLSRARANGKRIQLIDDLAPSPMDRDCLQSLLTPAGGRTIRVEDAAPPSRDVGRPAPGSRLSIEARLADDPSRVRAVLVLMTGDPAAPAKVLDVRSLRGNTEDACHAA